MELSGLNLEVTYTSLPDSFFTYVAPEPAPAPSLVVLNQKLATTLGLDLSDVPDHDLANILAGNSLPSGISTFAQAYAGHQFGHFTLLGDGRALLWGEQRTPSGDRVDIQFKGSGQTPYSRRGDGRASLGPMLREYIISEAMHALGIPTTRSLSVTRTGEKIERDGWEDGAVLVRIAASHIRVGTFEYAAAQGKDSVLNDLFLYTAKRHMPEVLDAENPALAFLKTVSLRQIALITHWMRVGFIHGVMNTDNMSISGETIDYGPCAFMDTYDPNTVFSSIDRFGRYAYGNQPVIAQWNIARFAETLLPLLASSTSKAIALAEQCVEDFEQAFHESWLTMMREKLGLSDEDPDDIPLISDLLNLMQKYSADYTNTFANLTYGDKRLPQALEGTPAFSRWLSQWKTRRQSCEQTPNAKAHSQDLMQASNPVIIPRNHLVEDALHHAESGDPSRFTALCSALAHPYAWTKGTENFRQPPLPSERIYQTFCGT